MYNFLSNICTPVSAFHQYFKLSNTMETFHLKVSCIYSTTGTRVQVFTMSNVKLMTRNSTK